MDTRTRHRIQLANVFSGRAPKPLVFVTLFTVMLSTVRLAAQSSHSRSSSSSTAPADVAAGLRVYNAVCVSCHGLGGAGVGNIDLHRGPLPRAATDAALSALITNGIPATARRLPHLKRRFLRTSGEVRSTPDGRSCPWIDRGARSGHR